MIFTTHAQKRMAERNISPAEVSWTVKYGQTFPHRDGSHRVYCLSNSLGIIYDPTDNTVITVWEKER